MVNSLFGKTQIQLGPNIIDFQPPFLRIDLIEELQRKIGPFPNLSSEEGFNLE